MSVITESGHQTQHGVQCHIRTEMFFFQFYLNLYDLGVKMMEYQACA